MKLSNKAFVSSILALCMVLSLVITTYATTRASAHLDSYRASLTPKSSSRIAITVDVDGTGLMDDIGATKIYVYRSTDNEHFYLLRTFDSKDYPAMMKHNVYYYYDTPIIFQGVSGYYYYAHVDVYAAKDGGSSTRSYTTSSVQASNNPSTTQIAE